MRNTYMKKHRVIAFLLLVLITATLVFSYSFIVINSDHHCTGYSCGNCEQLGIFISHLNTLNLFILTFSFAVLLFEIFLSYFCCFLTNRWKARTLVQLKVRFNN